MKTFEDFTFEEQKRIILNDEGFRNKFAQYVEETEMDYISEKLGCIKRSLSNWEITTFGYSFITVNNYFRFVDCVEDCKNTFGLSLKCEKLLEQCNKLRNSNLFEHYAKKLEDLYFDEEIQNPINWVNDTTYKISNGELDEGNNDLLSCFIDNGYLDGYEFEEQEDEDGNKCLEVLEPRDARIINF